MLVNTSTQARSLDNSWRILRE